MNNFWVNEWKQGKIFNRYSHSGSAETNGESLAHYGTQLAFFSILDKKIADEIYNKKIASQWNTDGFWGDKNNYYDQNWAWFGIALYSNHLPNLWVDSK